VFPRQEKSLTPKGVSYRPAHTENQLTANLENDKRLTANFPPGQNSDNHSAGPSPALQSRNMSAPVKVKIFGQTYAIQGDLDARYVQDLAKYVDEKMQVIADSTATVDTQKIAVLAALAIADELHSMQRERTDREDLLREQAERCLTLVERALKQTA